MSETGEAKFRLAIVRDTKRWEKSAVRAGSGITTTLGRFPIGTIRTCKALPPGCFTLSQINWGLVAFEINSVEWCLCVTARFIFLNDAFNWRVLRFHTPGLLETNVCCEQSSDVFVVDWGFNQFHLNFSVLTFNVIRWRVLEYSFNERTMSWFRWANEGFYLVIVGRLSC